MDRPILAGWSYGAVVAAHWASRHPDRTVGAVLVDGAYPYDWLDEAMERRIRKLYRRMGWFLPLLRPTGLTARMTTGQMADSNIELGRISRKRELGPVLDSITVPVRYVVASGTSFGSRDDEQEQIRTSLDEATGRNPNIQVRKVASGPVHGATACLPRSLGMRGPRCFPDRHKPRSWIRARSSARRHAATGQEPAGQSRQFRRKPEGERCSRA